MWMGWLPLLVSTFGLMYEQLNGHFYLGLGVRADQR